MGFPHYSQPPLVGPPQRSRDRHVCAFFQVLPPFLPHILHPPMAEGLRAPPPPGNGSECPDGARWVLRLLGECARDGRDVGSALLGLLSIGCFAAAALP